MGMKRRALGLLVGFIVFVLTLVATLEARAGKMQFKVKGGPVQENNGSWKISVLIDVGTPPSTPHLPMKFVFTKTVAYELSLIDGHDGPVESKQSLVGQTPSVESLDVDFGNGSGKIFSGTNFDFAVTRLRNYTPGEYQVRVRMSDGTDVGQPGNLTLLRTTNKDDENYKKDVVDRRTMAFSAGGKDKSIRKIDTGVDGGAAVAQNGDEPSGPSGTGEVTPAASADPFIPRSAYDKTPEEQGLKDHPKGCGCRVVGPASGAGGAAIGVMLGLVALGARRRSRRGPGSPRKRVGA
jgi:MYXO-CTERM domain-containing protein